MYVMIIVLTFKTKFHLQYCIAVMFVQKAYFSSAIRDVE
jgi:hypothetical protein